MIDISDAEVGAVFIVNDQFPVSEWRGRRVIIERMSDSVLFPIVMRTEESKTNIRVCMPCELDYIRGPW